MVSRPAVVAQRQRPAANAPRHNNNSSPAPARATERPTIHAEAIQVWVDGAKMVALLPKTITLARSSSLTQDRAQ